MDDGWSIRVSGSDIITANQFFRMHHRAKAETTRTWRALAYLAAAEAKLRKPLPRCDVTSRAVYPVSRKGPTPDTTAWMPMTKAIIDGLVDWGCWPDDRSEWIRAETFLPAIKSSKVEGPTIVIGLDPVDVASK